LHGHAFHVVRSAGNSTYNYVDPVVRDVVSIGDVATNDNVTIRFFTDNPGPWFLHCHIDWHLEKRVPPFPWTYLCATLFIRDQRLILSLLDFFRRGFAVVFAEDIPDVKTNDVPTRNVFFLWTVGCDL
jgi:hypothetical protein